MNINVKLSFTNYAAELSFTNYAAELSFTNYAAEVMGVEFEAFARVLQKLRKVELSEKDYAINQIAFVTDECPHVDLRVIRAIKAYVPDMPGHSGDSQ